MARTSSSNLPPARSGWLSIILPAHNEAEYIGGCLDALWAQEDSEKTQIILAANGCSDNTVDIARSFIERFAQKGWQLDVLELPALGKLGALNQAETHAIGTALIYLDADVICTPALIGALQISLDTNTPRYATGTMKLAPARSWISQRYGQFWMRLPFMQGNAPGAGVFAVNRSGRARWHAYPDIISDDTFVRLNFAPSERIQVSACYEWPLVEGMRNLVRVRRRQNAGVHELKRLYPAIFENDDKAKARMGCLFQDDPIGFIIYALVSLAVKLPHRVHGWDRGR